jgi:hypothetical protein
MSEEIVLFMSTHFIYNVYYNLTSIIITVATRPAICHVVCCLRCALYFISIIIIVTFTKKLFSIYKVLL